MQDLKNWIDLPENEVIPRNPNAPTHKANSNPSPPPPRRMRQPHFAPCRSSSLALSSGDSANGQRSRASTEGSSCHPRRSPSSMYFDFSSSVTFRSYSCRSNGGRGVVHVVVYPVAAMGASSSCARGC
jgi:hypothetical protein